MIMQGPDPANFEANVINYAEPCAGVPISLLAQGENPAVPKPEMLVEHPFPHFQVVQFLEELWQR